MANSEQVIEQLEANKKTIAHKIAEVIVQRQVQPYANSPVSQIEQAVIPSINMVLTYFRTDDSSALKADIQKRAADRVKSGYSVDELQKAIEIIAEQIERAIETLALGKETSPSLLLKYKSRVESIKALSKINVINYKLKEND